MKILDNLQNELEIRHRAWVILNNVLLIRNGSGELVLQRVLAKHLFFFSLTDEGKTLVIDNNLQELVLNDEEVKKISNLVYSELPLIDFELNVAGSEPLIRLPCTSSKLLAWSTIPEDILSAAFFSKRYSLKLYNK